MENVMTTQRTLKKQIRDRMGRTGERYTTARSHIIGSQKQLMVGGQQGDIAAVRNALAAAGVVGPDGTALTEAQVFGLAGGIGFLYGVFRYDGGPTMTITTRNTSMPDTFLDQLWSTEGLRCSVSTTGGVKKARTDLETAVADGRRALCSVGAGRLGYLGLPEEEAAMYPIVVGVISHDGGDYLIDDRSPVPHRIDAEQFAAARAVVRSAKHRMVTIDGGEPDWEQVIVSAVRNGADRYNTPPVKQFAANIGLAGLDKWRRLLTDSKDRMSWSKVFPEGPDAGLGFSRLFECVEHAYTAANAGRPLYAEFLRWAADVTTESRYAEAAEAADASGERWAAIADLSSSADPAVRRAAAAIDKRAELLDNGADPDKLLTAYRDQETAVEACRISAKHAAATRTQIAEELSEIIEHETTMLEILGAGIDRPSPPTRSRRRENEADRITMQNPNTGRTDNTMDRKMYDPVRTAILQALNDVDGVRFSDLPAEVEARTPAAMWASSKVGWYTTSVKLDLEARGLLERFDSPQRLRLTTAGRNALSN